MQNQQAIEAQPAYGVPTRYREVVLTVPNNETYSVGRHTWTQSVPPAVAGGQAVGTAATMRPLA
jgi:hypothetical protein